MSEEAGEYKTQRQYPHGKIAPDDEGEFEMRAAVDPMNEVIRIDFGKPIHWIALDFGAACGLHDLLERKIAELQDVLEKKKR